jgi:hypothetical protein
MKKLFVGLSIILLTVSCTENYSNGERIGVITQFSQTGIIWKSWEGHLNVTQSGMNSSVPFDFSVDNDHEDSEVIKTIDSAAQYGWKVKLIYHETAGKNWFGNRGHTDHFITKVEILNKNMVGSENVPTTPSKFDQYKVDSGFYRKGRVDTIYVVIDRSK